ncbi:MAG: peptidoglycan editing factor PgeF, partial [Candidatus Obscuribacterales bacterium]|nr:peptidoglycan editing factor PgeF [Candidatus Obscuribacterales bacterium]
PYDSFNLGRHIKDEQLRKDALDNREKLCQALYLSFARMKIPGQVHSKTVVIVEDQKAYASLDQVDGLSTALLEVPLLLHFADCVPVMVFERKKRIAAIFHAGWRGTAQGIVSHGIEIMARRFSIEPRDMVAAVGPAIGSCCYPTDQNVANSLKQSVKDDRGLIEIREGRPCPDLKGFNAMQLLEAGIEAIDVSDSCTACNPDVFYSHRQSGGITGRQGALICLESV